MKKINLTKLLGSIIFGFLMTFLIVLILVFIGVFISLMVVSFKFAMFMVLCLSLFVVFSCMWYNNFSD
jgi:hypothetical protein